METFFIQRMGAEHGPYTGFDLQNLLKQGHLDSNTLLRRSAGGGYFPAKDLPGLFSTREFMIAVILSFFLGGLGVDRFYVGHTGLGVAKLLTCGGLGIWSLIDLILFAMNKIKDDKGLPLKK